MTTARPFPAHLARHSRHARFWNTLIWTSISVGLALLLFLASSFSSLAQWPTDPANPLVICNAPSYQKSLRIASDGEGGWIVL